MTFGQKALDLISGIFMPSIGILCASGILKGVNVLLEMAGLVASASGLGQLLAAAADAMFLFFPVILGFNAFKKLGGNTYLGMTLGAAMCYPAIQGVALNVLGMEVTATYTSTVLSIIILSFVAVPFEKMLNKIVPDVVKTFVVPALVLGVMLPLGFCIIGPASQALANAILAAFNAVNSFSTLLARFALGFLWQILVMFGIHATLIMPMIMGLMTGMPQPLMAALGICSFVQTGAVIAIWVKTKNKKLKDVAFPAWISGIFGVTEPAIYGVTLPNGYQFWLTCAVAGVVAVIGGLMNVCTYQMGGMGVFGITNYINPADPSSSLLMGVLYVLIGTAAGFVAAFVTHKDAE